MLSSVRKSAIWKVVYRGLAFCMVIMIMLGTLPMGIAQADAAQDVMGVQAPAAITQENQPALGSTQSVQTYPPQTGEDSATQSYQPPEYSPFVQQTPTYTSPAPFNGMHVDEPIPGMTPSGDFLITGASTNGGSLPAGINTRSLPAGMITVDLTYDVVMGWVSPGATVEVTVGTTGYGMAVADDVGFFWTPVWNNTAGNYFDVNCGEEISIYVNDVLLYAPNPLCLDASLDIAMDQVNGSITGDPGGAMITATLGTFDIGSGGQPPAPGAPSVSDTTDSDGSFTLPFTGVDLGAESIVALDRVVGGVNIRSYAYPSEPVFMVQQYNAIAGYAPIGQQVTATVFADDTKVDVVWAGSTAANAPHGYYLFENVEMTIGNFIEVGPPGGPMLSTTLIELGNFDFVTTAGTLAGTAPVGASVRASWWPWSGEERLYQEAHATAVGGAFTMSFSPDLRPRDDVLVVVADAVGNQVQLLTGMPFINAWLDLHSDLDCVVGRLDGPGLPIIVVLESGGQEFERVTGVDSDEGNGIRFCFTGRDSDFNMLNFFPGDTVTLKTDDVGRWAGDVTIVDMNWSGNTGANSISGTLPAGDLEISVAQWNSWAYPLYGWANQQITHAGPGEFTADFTTSFDVRDGNTVYLSHFDPITGFGNFTHNWIETENLAFFELNLPHGIGGKVASANAGVTAILYDGDGIEITQTSDDRDDHPYWFWLDDFDGHPLQAGYKVNLYTANGWSAEMVIPDLSIVGDLDENRITITGPEGLLFIEVSDGDFGLGLFAPGPVVVLDLDQFGFDYQPSTTVAVTYEAPDGNRARLAQRLAEVVDVNFWLNPGTDDWMWGSANPGTQVTASNGVVEMFTAYADPACGGCWGNSTAW